MQLNSLVLLLATVSMLGACADSERYYGNIYAGMQTHEEIRNAPAESASREPSMSYQEYREERKRLTGTRTPD